MTRRPARKTTAALRARRPLSPWTAGVGWSALAALFLAVVAAPQLAAWLGRGAAPSGPVRYASGYTDLIDNVFAPMGWLVHHEDDADGLPAAQVVTLSDEAYRSAEIWDFYRQSFLRQDIQADDPKLWKFNGPAVTGIEPWAHAEPGPFEAAVVWRGDITFRDAANARPGLTWDGGAATFAESADPVDWSALPALSPAGASDALGGVSAGVRFVDETGQNLAAAIPIGQRLLLRVLPSSSAAVTVDGKAVIPPSDGAAYAVLREGDVLAFQRNGAPLGRAFVVRVGSGAISHFEPFADRQRSPGTEALAMALETALNGVAGQSAASGLAPPSVIRTTLDRDLQDGLRDILGGVADQVRAATGGRDFPAAATIMDANSGEVLALASYPAQAADQGAAPPDYNFKLLPIGSIAKVPFASAIVSAHPQLKDLVITGAQGQPFRTLFGIDLKKPFPEEAMAAEVDFPTFLIDSSNKYASSLMLLASARDPMTADGPATPQSYTLEGPRSRLPRIAFHERPDLSTGFGAPTDGLAGPLSAFIAPDGGSSWIRRLSTAFDLPRAERLAGDEDLYDYGDWASLAHGWDDAELRSLADVALERESFGLNAIGDLRDDYLSLILGGGRSRWSTLRVAEVFSRLVTGRQVSATLLAQDQPAPAPPLQGLEPVAVDAVLGALEQVPRQGTARLLATPLQPLQALAAARGNSIRIFAKTGTPRLQRPYRSAPNRAVDALIRLRYLELRRGFLRLSGDAGGGSMTGFFGAEPRIREELAEMRVSAADAAAYVAHLDNDLSPADRAARLAFGTDGSLAGLAPDMDTEPYSGGALAFVIARYDAGCPRQSPARALAVVINVQEKSKDKDAVNPAIIAAMKLLGAPVFQAALFAPGPGGTCGV